MPTIRLRAMLLGISGRLSPFVFALAVTSLATLANAQEPAADAPLDPEHAAKMAEGLALFKESVRDVLTKRCIECHGGDETESDFDLTTREGLLQGGAEGKAIIPGEPAKSRLVKLIKHELAPEMPFEEAQLEKGEVAAISKWIELGAPYDKPLKGEEDAVAWTHKQIDPKARDYWAFQPLKVIAPPAVKDEEWCRTPIDRFALAKLEEHKLTPNVTAEPRVLLRRIYLDLIGLPPTPVEITAFEKRVAELNAKDPHAGPLPKGEGEGTNPKSQIPNPKSVNIPQAALEELLDKLLASPHYGERWGRHWLDVARFAESHGFEQDYDRPHAYHYRDFVIRALNDDMAYDQFVRWQLAGDEIAPDQPLAMMATGFMGAGVFPTQLTEKEFESARYDELDDMVATTGTAFLGMTIGCARCHDHKFDPIPQNDYYRMVSAFRTTIRSEIDLDLTPPAELENVKAAHAAKLAELEAELAKFEREQLPAEFEKFVTSAKTGELKSSVWTVLDLSNYIAARGTKFERQADRSMLKVGDTPPKDTYTFTVQSPGNITALRIEALTHDSFPHKGPGLAPNGNFCLSNLQVAARPAGSNAQATPIKLTGARPTHQQNESSLSAAASFDGDAANSGWAVDVGGIGKDQAAVFVFEKPLELKGGAELFVTLTFDHSNTQHAIGRPRLSVTSGDPKAVPLTGDDAGIPEEVAKTIKKLAGGETVDDAARGQATRWFAGTLPAWQKLRAAVEAHRQSGPAKQQVAKVMVCSEGLPHLKHHADDRGFPHFYKESYFLKRGDVNQKQGEAPQSYLQVLMRPAASGERKLPESGQNQDEPDPIAELAATWDVAPPDGARTSYRRRALSNWITDTDRGAGQLLARVIVNRTWQQHFGRGIVATASDFGVQGERPTHPELLDYLAADFIEHGWKLKRLHKQIMLSSIYLQSAKYEAEVARLDPQNHYLWRYQPRRLQAEVIRDAMLSVSGQLDPTMFGPGTLDEGMRRRSVYFFVKRSKLIPMMQLFDQPEPLVSQGDRPATTIAPQALMFMNNPHVRGYAQSLAKKLLPAAQKSLSSAVQAGYVGALGREPSEKELKDNVEFLESQIASYDAEKKPAARELALADFCQVLFSLNEFVYVE